MLWFFDCFKVLLVVVFRLIQSPDGCDFDLLESSAALWFFDLLQSFARNTVVFV